MQMMPQSILPIALSSLLRATRQDVPWQVEANYIVPSAEKDGLPHASEGMRTHSGILDNEIPATTIPNINRSNTTRIYNDV